MEEREIAIQISGLKKRYKLGQIGGGTLYGDLQSLWARIRGKEDPNSKIGADSRSYGKTFMALNGIDLTVYQGEALGIIGHNGAGKSTLLKLLSRITAPTEGEIGMNGRIASMLEVGTGFNPHMTGRENIYMNGAILGMSKAEIDAKMEQIIEFSEVREFIDTPVKRYSSGMYVKLAFSVAAHLDSEIMIMDEVLAVGDMAFQKKCLSKMREAAKQDGRTVLYVSHNMNTIRQLCDRCVVLDQGKVKFVGDVEEAIKLYLNNGQEGCYKTAYNLSETPRPFGGSQHGVKARVLSMSFLDTSSCVFERKKPIRVRLEWVSNEKLQDLHFLFSIRSMNGVAVGAIESELVRESHKGEHRITELEMDFSTIAEGQYYMMLDLYSLNSAGTHYSFDHPEERFYFELKNEEAYSIVWRAQSWGYSRLHKMMILLDETQQSN